MSHFVLSYLLTNLFFCITLQQKINHEMQLADIDSLLRGADGVR